MIWNKRILALTHVHKSLTRHLYSYTSGVNVSHTRSHMWYLTYQGRSGHKHFLPCIPSHFSSVMRLLECALLKWSTVRKIVCIRIFSLNLHHANNCNFDTVILSCQTHGIFLRLQILAYSWRGKFAINTYVCKMVEI